MNVQPVSIADEVTLGPFAEAPSELPAQELVERIDNLASRVSSLQDETSLLLHQHLTQLRSALQERLDVEVESEAEEEMVLSIPPELDIIEAIIAGRGVGSSENLPKAEPTTAKVVDMQAQGNLPPLVPAPSTTDTNTTESESWLDAGHEQDWHDSDEQEEETLLKTMESLFEQTHAFEAAEEHQGDDEEEPIEPPELSPEPAIEMEPLEQLAQTVVEQKRPQAEAIQVLPRHLAYEAMAAPWRLEDDGLLVCTVPPEYEPTRIQALAQALERRISVIEVPHQEVVQAFEQAYGPVSGVDNDALLISLSQERVKRSSSGLLGKVRSWFRKT